MTEPTTVTEPAAVPGAGSDDGVLVRVEHLSEFFPLRGGILQRRIGDVKAVDDVSFEIRRGETLGLVGESGCGKTTVGRTLLRLIEPTGGRIVFDGADITRIKGRELKAYRRRMQIVFQDPYASLDPRSPIATAIGEGLRIHGIGSPQERADKVARMMDLVGLAPYHARRYPHEFSGGQRQRIGIARALVLEPDLLVCDEPVSALDVSIQAQVLNLLRDLQRRLNLTYLFIAHNMGVVEHISDRVAVMYLGALVEVADSVDIYRLPIHPYTIALLSAVPVARPAERTARRRIILRGDVPSPVNPPSGCRFHTRCWLRTQLGNPERCATERPELRVVAEPAVVPAGGPAMGSAAGPAPPPAARRQLAVSHQVACHYAEELLEPAKRQRRIAEAAAGSSGLASAEAADEAAAPIPTETSVG